MKHIYTYIARVDSGFIRAIKLANYRPSMQPQLQDEYTPVSCLGSLCRLCKTIKYFLLDLSCKAFWRGQVTVSRLRIFAQTQHRLRVYKQPTICPEGKFIIIVTWLQGDKMIQECLPHMSASFCDEVAIFLGCVPPELLIMRN